MSVCIFVESGVHSARFACLYICICPAQLINHVLDMPSGSSVPRRMRVEKTQAGEKRMQGEDSVKRLVCSLEDSVKRLVCSLEDTVKRLFSRGHSRKTSLFSRRHSKKTSLFSRGPSKDLSVL